MPSLIFDKVSPQPYGITINVSCSSDNPEGTLILYRNDIDVTSENNQDIVLPMGTYNYTCNVLESQNYSSATYSETFNIEKALGNVKLYLNGLEDNITIFSIQQLNITATTLYGNVTIYLNGTDITSENGINTTKSAGYYNVTAFSSGDENHSSAEITRWLNITEDLISPSISIISPSDGITYGYNENISLDFTVSDENLDSCWHNINSGSNVTISNCQNTNFSVAGSGNYTLYFYANDSYGNENSLEIIFSVQLDAPTILISFPSTVYLNYTNITFRYTPSDIDLETCELWGDFDGEFKLNQIDNNPSNYIENTFNLTLSDGVYRWNVRCSDSNGHSAFDGNKVFYVDTISPGISISQPQGKRTSRIGIPLQFSISDSSPTNCWYNVEWAIGGIVKANSSIANCFSTSFDLAADGNYILNFYVNDSASNFNFTNSSFTVDTSTPPSSSSSSSGGGGGGSGGVSIPKLQSSLSSEKIQDILVNKGGVKKILRWKVKNNGTTFLNECKFKSKGQYSSWIAYTETKGLAVGEEYTFVFDVNIPEAIEPGNYNLEVDLECKEVSTLTNFILQVVERKLDFVLVDFSRESDDSLKVKYSIEELSGEDQNVELQFLLFDSDGRQVTEVNETKYVPAKTKQEFETLINIDKDLSGKLNLLVNLNSETFSTFVQESLVLGSPISGFSISNIIGGGDNIISVILVILFLVFAFFIVKRIRHHKKTHRERVREMIRKNHHWK